MKNYDSYHHWKQWKLDFSYSKDEAQYFLAEFGEAAFPGRTIVELGFGNGGFLKFAQERGAKVVGIEIQDEIVEQARLAGFQVFRQLDDLLPGYSGAVDSVVALDVLEHMDHEGIRQLLSVTEKLLKPGGNMVVRVPNGSSPLGRATQYGDPTHLSILSPAILEHMCLSTTLQVDEARNPARVVGEGSALRFAGRKIQFLLRDVLNLIMSKVYGLRTTALDPNILIILKKS